MKKKTRKAMTLIEIVAVLAIIAVIMTLIAPRIFDNLKRGNISAAKAQVAKIETALERFQFDCGFFPGSPEPGLNALIEPPSVGRQCDDYMSGGYLKKKTEIQDPWKNPLNYVYPGQKNPDTFDLFSSGPDGQPGTDDDIGNWE